MRKELIRTAVGEEQVNAVASLEVSRFRKEARNRQLLDVSLSILGVWTHQRSLLRPRRYPVRRKAMMIAGGVTEIS